MNLPKRSVSDELLRLTVETKIEAGVSSAKIRELIEGFASYHDQEPDQATEIVGFMEVEDIPPDRRGTFLTALLSLAGDPNHGSRNLRQKMADRTRPRMTSPGALVSKVMAILRVRAQPAR